MIIIIVVILIIKIESLKYMNFLFKVKHIIFYSTLPSLLSKSTT